MGVLNVEKVIWWNRVYCGFLAGSWIVAGLLCFWARGSIPLIYETSAEVFTQAGIEQAQLSAVYGLIGVLSFVLSILNLLLLFAPRTRTWWAAHLFNHAMGVLKCCCIPAAVPLMIYWVRPEVQRAFETKPNDEIGA